MKTSVARMDWLLPLPMLASLLMISEVEPLRENAVVLTTLELGGILTGATLALALLVVIMSSVDRRCSEDYAFQVAASAALVSLGTTVLINLFWVLSMKFSSMPSLSGENMVGVAVLSWCLAYYWYRWRGITR